MTFHHRISSGCSPYKLRLLHTKLNVSNISAVTGPILTKLSWEHREQIPTVRWHLFSNIWPGDICPYQEYLSCYWLYVDQTFEGGCQGQFKVKERSRQGNGKVKARSRQAQGKVKASSSQDQGNVKSRLRQGQGKVKAMSRQKVKAEGQGRRSR